MSGGDRLAVFAYGSLVDRASASRTLGRPVPGVVPARLRGWRRRFSQARDNRSCEKTFARAGSGSVPEVILGLNLEPGAAGSQAPNGGLLELTPAELERLDLREVRYHRQDVSDSVELLGPAPAFDCVVAYVARREHFAASTPPGAVILHSYATAVESAFDGLGPGEGDEYRRTTLPYPAELIDGVLVRDEIPEGNPRDW